MLSVSLFSFHHSQECQWLNEHLEGNYLSSQYWKYFICKFQFSAFERVVLFKLFFTLSSDFISLLEFLTRSTNYSIFSEFAKLLFYFSTSFFFLIIHISSLSYDILFHISQLFLLLPIHIFLLFCLQCTFKKDSVLLISFRFFFFALFDSKNVFCHVCNKICAE